MSQTRILKRPAIFEDSANLLQHSNCKRFVEQRPTAVTTSTYREKFNRPQLLPEVVAANQEIRALYLKVHSDTPDNAIYSQHQDFPFSLSNRSHQSISSWAVTTTPCFDHVQSNEVEDESTLCKNTMSSSIINTTEAYDSTTISNVRVFAATRLPPANQSSNPDAQARAANNIQDLSEHIYAQSIDLAHQGFDRRADKLLSLAESLSQEGDIIASWDDSADTDPSATLYDQGRSDGHDQAVYDQGCQDGYHEHEDRDNDDDDNCDPSYDERCTPSFYDESDGDYADDNGERD